MSDALDTLPALHARWLRGALDGPPPLETTATCASCVMCAPPGAPRGPEHFLPSMKCCTYLPRLANFLVGGILRDRSVAGRVGRRTVRARIAAREAVSPLGLGPTPAFVAAYAEDVPFGRTPALRCPHYVETEGGTCSIWQHREATCATWFCKHDRGATGLRFWQSLEALLGELELSLARYAVRELGLPTGDEAEGPASGARTKKKRAGAEGDAWGAWAGREAALYVKCAAIVEGLSWEEVSRIGGARVADRVAVARARQAELAAPAVHAALARGPFVVTGRGGGVVRLRTYSEFDLIDVPTRMVRVLRQFEGRSTSAALSRIEADGVALEPAALQRLVDYEMLVPRAPRPRRRRAV